MGYPDRQGLNFAVAIEHARALLEGRALSAADAALGPGLERLSPAVESGAERTRIEGTTRHEQTLAQLARQADEIDNGWRQFRSSC